MFNISPSWETNLKTTFALAALITAFSTLVGAVAGAAGLYTSLALSVGTSMLTMWYSKELVIWLMGAKQVKIQDKPAGFDLNRMVKKLCHHSAINLKVPPTVYIIESDELNAFATGRTRNHTAIAITRGLLNKAKKQAHGDMKKASRWIEAIWCHELGHIINSDIQTKTVSSLLVGGVRLLSETLANQEEKRNSSFVQTLVGSILFYFVIPFTGTLLGLWLSRTREFAADDTAAKCGRAKDLADAFDKLLRHNVKHPHKKKAHSHSHGMNEFSNFMCLSLDPANDRKIYNGLNDKNIGWLNWFGLKAQEALSTHPSIDERIKRMKKAASHR